MANQVESCFCFVTTSLDTHLVVTFHEYENVSTFEEKVCVTHNECFEGIGEIDVTAVKVKIVGQFYHMTDTVILSKALEGLLGTSDDWIIDVEVVRKKEVAIENQVAETKKEVGEKTSSDELNQSGLVVGESEKGGEKSSSEVIGEASQTLKQTPEKTDGFVSEKDIESGEGSNGAREKKRKGKDQSDCEDSASGSLPKEMFADQTKDSSQDLAEDEADVDIVANSSDDEDWDVNPVSKRSQGSPSSPFFHPMFFRSPATYKKPKLTSSQ